MSSDLDEDVRRVAARRELDQALYERSVSPPTRRDATASSISRRRTIAPSDDDDDDDGHTDIIAAAPPKKKQKRALPRFAGDGLSDEDGGASANQFFDQADDNNDDEALWAGLDGVPNAPGAPAAAGRDGPDDSQFVFDIDGVAGAGDGVDQVVKKKRVYAKLDEERLSGPLGFPKLREIALSFKPKGKGHEFQDLKRMMSMYQLWAHRMFPKTNLADTLKTIEKVCHKRSMLSTLRQIRDEHKHGGKKSNAELLLDEGEQEMAAQAEQGARDGDVEADPAAVTRPTTSTFVEVAGDDLWDDDEAILRDLENDMAAAAAAASATQPRPAPARVEDDDEDEDAEAFMRELELEQQQASTAAAGAKATRPPAIAEEEEDEDEDAIMREIEMEDMMKRTASTTSATSTALSSKDAPQIPPRTDFEMDRRDDEDDEAVLREFERTERQDQTAEAPTIFDIAESNQADGVPSGEDSGRKSASPVKKAATATVDDGEEDLWAVDDEVLRELEANRS